MLKTLDYGATVALAQMCAARCGPSIQNAGAGKQCSSSLSLLWAADSSAQEVGVNLERGGHSWHHAQMLGNLQSRDERGNPWGIRCDSAALHKLHVRCSFFFFFSFKAFAGSVTNTLSLWNAAIQRKGFHLASPCLRGTKVSLCVRKRLQTDSRRTVELSALSHQMEDAH